MIASSESRDESAALPKADMVLPVRGPAFRRPDPDLLAQLRQVSTATASAMMHKIGLRQTFIQGPISRQPGAKVAGPAVTLQFMPQREDIASGQAQENVEERSALWAVLEEIQPGDILAIQGHNDPYTGCLGEMLITYFKGRGGSGIVVDGYIRDWPHVQPIGVPLWTRGFTPNYASQASYFPWAYNVPVDLNRVLVLPGDILIADDDGVVLVPAQIALILIQRTLEHEDWESFSRIRLAQGGALKKYYPLNEEGQAEYKAWRAEQGQPSGNHD